MSIVSSFHSSRLLNMSVYPNNEFLLVEVEGSEYLSHPYCYKLTALSYDRDINIENLLNQPVSVTITQGQQVNYLHGLIFESKRAELGADGMQTYHFFICPWLRFLELKSDCRIFSTKEPLTIPQILTTVFKENNYLDYDISGITKKYEPLVSCTQYNESHFNFVSRLMEQHGLYYYFKHEHDRHILCIADAGLPTLTQAPHQLQFGLENPDKTAALTDWHNVSSVMGSASCTSIFNFGQPGKPRIVDMCEPKKRTWSFQPIPIIVMTKTVSMMI